MRLSRLRLPRAKIEQQPVSRPLHVDVREERYINNNNNNNNNSNNNNNNTNNNNNKNNNNTSSRIATNVPSQLDRLRLRPRPIGVGCGLGRSFGSFS